MSLAWKAFAVDILKRDTFRDRRTGSVDPRLYLLGSYCILEANFIDGESDGFPVLRGQLARSYSRIATELDPKSKFLSRNAVRYSLLRLVNRHFITISPDFSPNCVLITVCNYDKYQPTGSRLSPEHSPERHRDFTGTSPALTATTPKRAPIIDSDTDKDKDNNQSEPIVTPIRYAQFGGIAGMVDHLCKILEDPDNRFYYEVAVKNYTEGQVELALADTLAFAATGKMKKTKAETFAYQLKVQAGILATAATVREPDRGLQRVEPVVPPPKYAHEDEEFRKLRAHRDRLARERRRE